MAAGPVRKLLNPPPQGQEEREIQLGTNEEAKKTPFNMKELMVLNQRTMFLAQNQQNEKVFIVTPKTTR